jgi:hypothetical protein
VARKKPVRLPNKLSALLRIAVADAKAVEKDKRYRLDMMAWHTPAGAKCSVCMAGATMAKTLTVDIRKDVDPSSLSASTNRRLRAIDYMRTGYFSLAADQIGVKRERWSVSDHALDRAHRLVQAAFDDETDRAPWSAYELAAGILEEANL